MLWFGKDFFVPSKIKMWGTFLVVQWLRLHTSTSRGMGWSLVRKLRSHMPRGVARKIKRNNVYISKCLFQGKFSSVDQSLSCFLRPHGLQHSLHGLQPPCPSPTPGVYSNSCPLSQWCHPTISSSVVPFSSCLQSFPASGSFQMSQFFTSGGQSIGIPG